MMYKFHFALRTNATALGLHQIYIDASINKLRSRTPINLYVPRHAFNAATQRCQTVPGYSRQQAANANKIIVEHATKCQNIINAALATEQQLTPKQWQAYLQASNFTNFVHYAQNVTEEKLRLGEIVPATAKTYHQAISQLISLHGPIIPFAMLADVARHLEAHLKAKGLNKNTRKKTHTRIKTIILHAQKQGIALQNPYTNFKIGTIQGNRVALNEAELRALFNLYRAETLPAHLQNTLQYFLFSCLTGLRYSDITELTTRNLQADNLVFTPQKTKRLEKQIEMRLPAPAKQLITVRTGKLFSTVSSQKSNQNVKAICAHLGIKKHVTFHCARHSFGTLFMHFGGNLPALQELMGHSKIETTSHYLHMAESLKTQSVTLFDGI